MDGHCTVNHIACADAASPGCGICERDGADSSGAEDCASSRHGSFGGKIRWGDSQNYRVPAIRCTAGAAGRTRRAHHRPPANPGSTGIHTATSSFGWDPHRASGRATCREKAGVRDTATVGRDVPAHVGRRGGRRRSASRNCSLRMGIFQGSSLDRTDAKDARSGGGAYFRILGGIPVPVSCSHRQYSRIEGGKFAVEPI